MVCTDLNQNLRDGDDDDHDGEIVALQMPQLQTIEQRK